MSEKKADILGDLTRDLNIADTFISKFNEKYNFNRLNFMRDGVNEPGLSLSRNMYDELEARCNFEFLVINRPKNE